MALIKVNSRQLFIFRQDQAMTPEKEEFVKRLEEVVNLLGYPKHGTQTQLAIYYKLKQPSVKKWFHGESMPAYEVAANLCKRAYVSYEWLMTGRGEKHFIEDVAQLDPQTKAATLLMESMDAQEKYQAVQVLTALAQSKKHENPRPVTLIFIESDVWKQATPSPNPAMKNTAPNAES